MSSPGVGDVPTADPELRGESTLAMQISIVTAVHVIALIFAILRMYNRIVLAKAYGWDDGFMIGATVCGY